MIKLKDILNEESVTEDFWALPAEWSSQEARLHLDKDIKDMSKILGKASQQVIKVMMDGVKGGKYDAMDIIEVSIQVNGIERMMVKETL